MKNNYNIERSIAIIFYFLCSLIFFPEILIAQVNNLGLANGDFNIAVDGNLTAFIVPEADQNNTDLNGDGDTLDLVLHFHNAATNTTTNLGLDGTSFDVSNNIIAFSVDESKQGNTDLNSDGDTNDIVLHLHNSNTNITTNLGFHVADALGIININSTINFTVVPFIIGDGIIAFAVNEQRQGNTDLNGDGDTNDFVIHIHNTSTSTTTNLGFDVANRYILDGNLLVFRVSEQNQGNTDLNSDLDTNDIIFHVHDTNTNMTDNLELNSYNGSSTQFVAGNKLIAFALSETGENNTDLNGDSDTDDIVLHVHNLDTDSTTNLGLDVTNNGPGESVFFIKGNLVGFGVNEVQQGNTDLNGNSVIQCCILHIYDANDNTTTNSGLVSSLGIFIENNFLAFAVSEGDQGGFGFDLNSDGDDTDTVLHLYDGNTKSTTNLGLVSTGDFTINNNLLIFPVVELEQGETDLNGDGDNEDSVVHTRDVNSNVILNLGLHGLLFAADENFLIFPVDEFFQGETDLNGDGDSGSIFDVNDLVLHFFDKSENTISNTGFDAGGGFNIEDGLIVFSVNEAKQGNTDLNGDGDMNDLVIHILNLNGQQDIDVLIVDDLNSSEPFTNHPIITIPPVDEAIGAITELSSPGGLITRANGDMEPITIGAPIFEGDVIETDENQELDIMFIDESEFSVSENARLKIDEYVFDPTESTGPSGFSWLRGVFVFTSGLIGRDEPEDVNDVCNGICSYGTGIRGSAEDIIREDLLNNPMPEFGDVGIWVETASPNIVSTFVEIPDDPFNLKFDHIFLDEAGDLSVSLCGSNIFQSSASPDIVGLTQSSEVPIDMPAMTCELKFQIDGEPDESVIITNLEAPGTGLLDFDVWFKGGDGSIEFVYLSTIEQLLELQSVAEEITDSDGDGTPDSQDGCPDNPNKIEPGVCGCGVTDMDSDGDGTADCNDQCPNDINKVSPGICGCGTEDTDSDNDGTPNCNDQCPSNSSKITPGMCGCSVADTDSDQDGIPDCNDECVNDTGNDVDGDGICGNLDNCPEISNPTQSDADNNGIGDACDEVNDTNPITVDVNATTISINNNSGDLLNDLEVMLNIDNSLGILGVSLDTNSGECVIEQENGRIICQIDQIDDVVNVILQLCKEGDIQGVAQVVVNVLAPSIELDAQEVVDIILNDLQVCNIEEGSDGSNGGCSLASGEGRTTNKMGHLLPLILLPLIMFFRRKSRTVYKLSHLSSDH